ncbi:M15 family metallopeptidase [Deinococcus fonticola]|uniref:M15 family metallopeptidase n=1 Tax=Deinococcus fonticola TaxID=2528713 RepID=UPI001074D514|nr:M15 family metallopeptidase [Deinococcus fonticola]
MSNFDFAAAIATRPAGDTREQLVAAYGDPLAGSRSGSQKGWFEPSDTYRTGRLVRIATADLPGFPDYPGQKTTSITLNRAVEPVFRATWAELVRRGLNTRLRTYDGSLACRHMGHDVRRPISVHAYGAAIDFDARWNGYGVPLERMGIDREVVRCFEECGWEWGGRWADPYEDGMHFQWTDPLAGVRQAEWRDAMARPQGPVIPANWVQVRDAATGKPIPGQWVSSQRRADGSIIPFQVQRDRLIAAGVR